MSQLGLLRRGAKGKSAGVPGAVRAIRAFLEMGDESQLLGSDNLGGDEHRR
jgi:hypothetical protein